MKQYPIICDPKIKKSNWYNYNLNEVQKKRFNIFDQSTIRFN